MISTRRSYVYDEETGLYYLQSRYYNPEWGRFINADAFISTGGLLGNNMFAYCYSNPINWIDKGGNVPEEIDLNDNPTDDLFPDTDGGAVGGPTGYNPIDAGYHYGVDMSQAANSSIHSGGLYTNGYKAFGYYTDPNSSNVSNSAKGNNPLIDISYTEKVVAQMQLDDFHGFPILVDNYGAYGELAQIKGGDGCTYNKLMIAGYYLGHNGYFVYMWGLDNICNHRCFEAITL